MAIDTDRIVDCVLALLLPGRHDGQRVWKTFDWDAMDQVHEKGFISDPVGRGQISHLYERWSVEGRATIRGTIREKTMSGMGSRTQTTYRFAAR